MHDSLPEKKPLIKLVNIPYQFWVKKSAQIFLEHLDNTSAMNKTSDVISNMPSKTLGIDLAFQGSLMISTW